MFAILISDLDFIRVGYMVPTRTLLYTNQHNIDDDVKMTPFVLQWPIPDTKFSWVNQWVKINSISSRWDF